MNIFTTIRFIIAIPIVIFIGPLLLMIAFIQSIVEPIHWDFYFGLALDEVCNILGI